MTFVIKCILQTLTDINAPNKYQIFFKRKYLFIRLKIVIKYCIFNKNRNQERTN